MSAPGICGSRGQRERHDGIAEPGAHPVVAAGSDDDELSPACDIGHRRRLAAGRQGRLPQLLAGRDRSPDRVDALVWALTDLLVEPMPGEAIIEFYRLRAREAAEKKGCGGSDAAPPGDVKSVLLAMR